MLVCYANISLERTWTAHSDRVFSCRRQQKRLDCDHAIRNRAAEYAVFTAEQSIGTGDIPERDMVADTTRPDRLTVERKLGHDLNFAREELAKHGRITGTSAAESEILSHDDARKMGEYFPQEPDEFRGLKMANGGELQTVEGNPRESRQEGNGGKIARKRIDDDQHTSGAEMPGEGHVTEMQTVESADGDGIGIGMLHSFWCCKKAPETVLPPFISWCSNHARPQPGMWESVGGAVTAPLADSRASEKK
jgi:hypothetical protein